MRRKVCISKTAAELLMCEQGITYCIVLEFPGNQLMIALEVMNVLDRRKWGELSIPTKWLIAFSTYTCPKQFKHLNCM